ncbi:MAG TPA: adenylyltransferase/cytidyltransferase family protein [Patescibacteria group bacterium]|nr:adenylyltransferase/cytidyltransferase family protein [Patescibacteria group bacterium]
MREDKIITPDKALQIAKLLHNEKKSIVLVGGCFDILHLGHITFLEQAKKQGDILFVFVESDHMIKHTKGDTRPVNNQHDRVKILSHLDLIDYLIPLSDKPDYDELVIHIKPAIIATTRGDANRFHKERQANEVGARVVDVTDEISNKSTTKIIKILEEI